MIKVKVKPEDFIVEEIADVPMSRTGDFCVYRLQKRGWNTVDVLKNLSRKLHLPSSVFSYGGKKDKYALTSQYITIARQGYKQTTPSVFAPLQGGVERVVKNPWIKRRNLQSPSVVNPAEIERLIPTKLARPSQFEGCISR
ncbi:MAG: tRNA pseudouridine(13) synthase TruD [Candidatus Brocadiaceae bacterium]|nr:tRNA pseudouridine(13) synthase TruD [Candidatus Brocadiaceae bacterium]